MDQTKPDQTCCLASVTLLLLFMNVAGFPVPLFNSNKIQIFTKTVDQSYGSRHFMPKISTQSTQHSLLYFVGEPGTWKKHILILTLRPIISIRPPATKQAVIPSMILSFCYPHPLGSARSASINGPSQFFHVVFQKP